MSKRIYWDIETSKFEIKTETFTLWDNIISHKDITKEWYIICAAWVEDDNKRAKAVSVLDDPKRFKADPHDDYHVVKTLHKMVIDNNGAEFIAHNGDAFDWKKLNARVMYHKLPPLPPVKKIDTLKVTKKHLKETSHRLDYLAEKYCGHGKMETTKGLWDMAWNGETKAINEMVKYNKQDVIILRDYFQVIKPYASLPYSSNGDCPKCGGLLTKQGFKNTKTRKYQQFKCRDCGSWSNEVVSLKNHRPTIVSV